MSSAGQQFVAGRIPGERIATARATSDSSTNSDGTEYQVMSVTASLVSGRSYRVRFCGSIQADAAADMIARIREDDINGTQLQAGQIIVNTSSSVGFWVTIESDEFTAPSTADKTFVATLDRNSGSAVTNLHATVGQPAKLYVDYIEG